MAFGGFMGAYFSRQAISLAADYERASIAFEVMTKSATVGRNLLNQINQLAIETPFQSSELVKSAKQVMAFGFEVHDVIPILSKLGDVSVATGSDMDRLILALGQVRTTGRLMGQELRQFTNAGVPILEYLAKVLGKTSSEIPNLVRQGRISFGDVAEAINMMTDSGGLFFGMMDRINKETVSGRWANLKETVQLTARSLGLAAFDAFRLNQMLTDLSDSLRGITESQAREFFAGLRLTLYTTWQIILKLVETAIKYRQTLLAILAAIILLNIAQTILNVLIAGNLLLWMQWIIAVAVLTGAVAALYNELDKLGTFDGLVDRLASQFGRLAPAIKEAWEGIQDAIKGNDMELAFTIMMEGLRTAWKSGLLIMEMEWRRFSLKLDKSVSDAMIRNLESVAGESVVTEKLLRPVIDRLKNVQIVKELNLPRQLAGLEKELAGELLGGAATIANLRNRAAVAAAFPKGTFGGNLSHELFNSLNTGEPFDEGALRNKIIGAQGPGIGGALVRSRQLELFGNAAQAMMFAQDKILHPGNNPQFTVEQMVKKAADAAKQLENFQAVIGKVGTAADRISKPLQFSDSSILHEMGQLEKEFMMGATAMDRFAIGVSHIREAADGFGPQIRNLLGNAGLAAFGGAALQGNPGAIIDRAEETFGIFKRFQDLQKEVGHPGEKFAPAMMAGSREAAETINRSNAQSLSVEQQVLETLREGNIVRAEQSRYMKVVADTIKANPQMAEVLKPAAPH